MAGVVNQILALPSRSKEGLYGVSGGPTNDRICVIGGSVNVGGIRY